MEIIDLPLAADGGHMNFYRCNGAAIVPVSGDKAEDDAPLGILREVVDDREVSGRILAKGGGCVRCITQQIPA